MLIVCIFIACLFVETCCMLISVVFQEVDYQLICQKNIFLFCCQYCLSYYSGNSGVYLEI